MPAGNEQQPWLSKLGQLIKNQPRLIVDTPEGRSGVLAKESTYVFNYGEQAVDPRLEVAIGLPYRIKSYQSGDLFGIFSMNEPEGYLRLYIEDVMSRIGIPNKLLLLALTQGLQIGRVSYRHESLALPGLNAENLETLVSETSTSYFDHLLSRFALRSGLSGAQPKVVVPLLKADAWPKVTVNTPSLIVKSAGAEFPGVCLNEFFCMSVAKRAGLEVPDFWLSDDANRFLIARFDRDAAGRAVGFEDMAVLSGVTAAKKYQGSYEGILKIARTYCGDKTHACETMFSRIATSALLRDGDAHLKNFGLVYDNPATAIRPAPAYDIVCTAIYPDLDRGLALSMNKGRTFPTITDLLKLSRTFSIADDVAKNCINRIEAAIDSQLEASTHDARFLADSNDTLRKLRAQLRP